ncbi:MAG TPA: PadR family transcriptional regulator [Gemmatimonadales bacterium]|nr:PadR family transcriptional regulator [Gemmatimonadales bacterium]
MTTQPRRELLPGTLDMLILKSLTLQAMHGYGIAQHIHRLSQDVIRVEEGSLYPALQRMRQKGWIQAEWRLTPNNQWARYYSITRPGRRQLGLQETGFADLMSAIARVMRPA